MFSFSKTSKLALGSTRPTNLGVPGRISTEAMPPRQGADKLSPSSIQVQNSYIYTVILPYTFRAWC
jgi:hypothetical protein